MEIAKENVQILVLDHAKMPAAKAVLEVVVLVALEAARQDALAHVLQNAKEDVAWDAKKVACSVVLDALILAKEIVVETVREHARELVDWDALGQVVWVSVLTIPFSNVPENVL